MFIFFYAQLWLKPLTETQRINNSLKNKINSIPAVPSLCVVCDK